RSLTSGPNPATNFTRMGHLLSGDQLNFGRVRATSARVGGGPLFCQTNSHPGSHGLSAKQTQPAGGRTSHLVLRSPSPVSALHVVDRRPRRSLTQGAEEFRP